MAWLIVAHDSEHGPECRADTDLMDTMWQYELEHLDSTLLAGSLREDDKQTKNGSVMLLDVETRAEAEAFLANDPTTRAGMRGKIEIRWLNVAIINKEVQD